MTGTAVALHATVLVGVLVGIPVTWRALGRDPDRRSVGGSASGSPRWYHRPGWWLAWVIAAVFCNQVLFTVYALRVRHGDLSDLARSVPSGWFELADNRFMTALAAHVPAPHLLSVTALRIPSLLELPFGLLAYLTVVNWLDPRRYRRLATPAVLALACGAYTVTFCLIEWALPTPYTRQDLALRAISGVLCALALPWLGRHRSAPPGVGAPRSPAELLAFATSTAALGYLVLAIYDTAMLYSLGRLGDHLPGAGAAIGILAVSRLASGHLRRLPRRSDGDPAGAGVDTLSTALSWWLALFLIPALAIRYELGFGSWLIAAGAGTLVIAAAATAALREVAARLATVHHLSQRAWLGQLAVAGFLGLASAGIGLASPAAYPETRLLRAAALFTVTTTAVCAWWDRRQRASTAPPGFRVSFQEVSKAPRSGADPL
ncbi:MAG: hypothetical protein JXA67_07460 [Micromonosporaceae bacterium]|nr:hypothetical protein [Micromonosporaceae bacterium]